MLAKLRFKYLIGLFPVVTVLALAAISLATANPWAKAFGKRHES